MRQIFAIKESGWYISVTHSGKSTCRQKGLRNANETAERKAERARLCMTAREKGGNV